MESLKTSDDEARRLARLHELFVLDSAPEPVFDAIVRLASEVCGAPIALISLVDAERQWFKAMSGLAGVEETPRDISFCTHALLQDDLLEVPDTTQDPRFAANPLVTGDLDVRFYAGAPLVLAGGERVGTLCVVDHRSRRLDDTQARMLRSLAEIATQALTMRRDLIVKSLSVRTDYEAALAASAAEYADLYENAPTGFHSLDAEGRFMRVNATELGWLGCTSEEVIGRKTIRDFLTPAGQALFRERFPQLMAEGRLDDIEFDLVGRDGEVRHLLASATVIRDAQGAFVMTRTASYDVTELRRMKSAHEKLTAERDAILDTELMGVVKLKDRRIAWCNPGMERLLGYERGELAGQATRVFYLDDESHARMAVDALPVLATGAVYRTQLPLRRKDGSRVWIDMSAKAFPDAPADPLCLMVDITALKRAEEIRVQKLALEAENRQLVETSRIKGLFLSNMSHELYTPLNAIIGYSHMLAAGTLPADSPRFAKYLGQIGSSGRQLLELIQTVLNFADVELGKFALEPVPLRLRDVIRGVVDTCLGSGGNRGVTVVDDFDPTIDAVVTDRLRLAQMVSHYLSNAIKFSHPDGGVTVRTRPDGDANFRVEVADRGIGIAEGDRARLFAPFRQLSEGLTKSHPGAGLSLALTRLLVEAQGGSFGLESRLGAGSTFWFSLPRQLVASPPS